MKRLHLGLAGLALGIALVQVGCATLPTSLSTGSKAPPEDVTSGQNSQIEGFHLLAAYPGQRVVPMGTIGEPIPGLYPDQMTQFNLGKKWFDTDFGLDHLDHKFEVFNAPPEQRSCKGCHALGGAGGAGVVHEQFMAAIYNPYDPASIVTGGFLADPNLPGGPVLQLHADPYAPVEERVADPGNDRTVAVSRRQTNQIAGDGFLAAIPDAQILDRAAHQSAELGLSGRPAHSFFFTPGQIGKFGWKATAPDVRGFNAVAFVEEQAVGNPDNVVPQFGVDTYGQPVRLPPPPFGPINISAAIKAQVDVFSSLMLPPAPKRVDAAGLAAFKKAGCIECHWSGYTTTKNPNDLTEELRDYANVLAKGEVVPAFTDLLVHKMGTGTFKPFTSSNGQTKDGGGKQLYGNIEGNGLADAFSNDAAPGVGGPDPLATRGDEFRTAPLWGLHLRSVFLHDGRAKTIDEAIRLHYFKSPVDKKYDSEGNQVVLNYLGQNRYSRRNLTNWERAALLNFCRNL